MFHWPALLLTIPAAVVAAWAQTAVPRNPVVFLWPGDAPGSEGKTGDEKIRKQLDDQIVSSVHRPSITVYLPAKGKATGAAAFVLKYRLAREAGSSYTVLGHALPDMQRAIRTVRARSVEWGVDPNRVGVMGFSAGAELAGVASTHFDDPVAHPIDDIDRQSAKPAFQALIYPPGAGAATYSKDTPQAFLACGGDDTIAAGLPDLYMALKSAGVPVELHIYAGVGHGFGIRESNPPAVAGWIDRFRDWMFDRGLLTGK